MNTLKRVATPMLIAVLLASPAYAGIESCRDPTPDEQFQLDLCKAHAGCIIVASVISDCAKVTAAIKKFFSSQKPELDPGEYKGDQDAPLGPSEREQARKDRELYQGNRSLEETGAREAYHQLRALDWSIKERLEKYCGNPLDGLCRNTVHDAESLVSQVDTYNSNAAFVRLRGKLTPESPGIAAPYGKIQEADREKFRREQDEHNKRMREMDDKIKRTQDADKRQQEGAKALATAPEPTNDEQKTLYALGLAINQSLGSFNLSEAELDLVKSGIADGVFKKTPKVDLQTFGPKIQQLKQARASVVAGAEKKAVAAAPPTQPAAKASPGSSEGNGSGSSASSRGAAGSASCAPDEGLLRKYVEAHLEWVDTPGMTKFPERLTIEKARKNWYERLDQEMSGGVESFDLGIARRTEELEKLNWSNHPSPNKRAIHFETRLSIQRWECASATLKARKAEKEVQNAKKREEWKSAQEMDCTVRFDSLTAEKTRHERRLDKGEVVRLSELAMWYINKGTALIDRWCPDSVRYRKERDALQQSYKELQRVCDAHASSPPCAPRLPGKDPAPAP